MLARRLLLLVAIMMGITALAAGLTAPPVERRQAQPPPPSLGEARPPAAPPVVRTLDADAPRTITVAEGDELRLTVHADDLDVVELSGLDRIQAVSPQTPAIFDVLADEPGSDPVLLRQSGGRAGTLEVTPASG
jgi:hypothetical protein